MMIFHGRAAALPGQEAAPEERVLGLILAEHDPLPDGLEESDESVIVIRLCAPTPEEVEAARAAY
jgi:hypothetical protein